MMSALTQKLDEVRRLSTIYHEYKDSAIDPDMRRKVHLDVDRFLMSNRETALICMEQVLVDELHSLKEAQGTGTSTKAKASTRLSMLKRLISKGGVKA